MGSVNKVFLVGRLGKDPEIRQTPNGQPVCNFSVATSESWTDKERNRQERTEWHKVVTFGKVAENCGKYLTKGKEVCIEGSLQTREWTDKDGGKRYTTEIKATVVTFLGGGSGRQDQPAGGISKPAPPPDFPDPPGSGPPFDDDLPF